MSATHQRGRGCRQRGTHVCHHRTLWEGVWHQGRHQQCLPPALTRPREVLATMSAANHQKRDTKHSAQQNSVCGHPRGATIKDSGIQSGWYHPTRHRSRSATTRASPTLSATHHEPPTITASPTHYDSCSTLGRYRLPDSGCYDHRGRPGRVRCERASGAQLPHVCASGAQPSCHTPRQVGTPP